jgi:cell division protein FtsI/penicillin-binding protein 2
LISSPVETLEHSCLRQLLADRPPTSLTRPAFSLESGIRRYQIHTSIDPELQKRIADSIDKRYARSFGLVAMQPESGRIVAMVSFDRHTRDANICTQPAYPAASLFKIVTAAAVIEECGFTDNTSVSYNGKKYSLYKSQLKHVDNRYTRHLSFAASFADSINPVFGKLGIHRLKRAGLEEYAAAFGFNRSIAFDLPFPESPVAVSKEPYNWAEIACGFNRQTLISPLHAAVLVSAVANRGRLPAPTLVDTVAEEDAVVYRRKPRTIHAAVSPQTAETLKNLMYETVESGTARKTFRDAGRDRTLSRLRIGGKTGSINNNPLHIKYDWFAGFGEERKGGGKLAVAVLVAHKEYIGTRAAEYAKMALRTYFHKPDQNTRTEST